MTALDWRSARLAPGTASALGLGRFAYGLLVPAMTEQLHSLIGGQRDCAGPKLGHKV